MHNPLMPQEGDPLFSGLRVFILADFPQKQAGWTAQRYAAHPLIVWLYRQINRTLRTSLAPDIVRRIPRMIDAEPLIDKRHGHLYVSSRQYAMWSALVRERSVIGPGGLTP